METKSLGRIAVIGRFKPLHIGGALMLEAICEKAEHAIIGIGSSNKYNVRNPFTAEESEKMAHAYLSPRFSNYETIHVPDFAHIPEYSNGQKWRKYVKDNFGDVDLFVSANDYVSELLKEDYNIVRPSTLIPPEKHIQIRATKVRVRMARFEEWNPLVPDTVVEYLENNEPSFTYYTIKRNI